MKVTTANINELPPHLKPIGQMELTIDGVVYNPVVGLGWFVIDPNGRGQVGGMVRTDDSVFFGFDDIEQSQDVEGVFGTDQKFYAFFNHGSWETWEAVSGNYKGLINLEERVVKMDFEFTAKAEDSERQSKITASMKFRFDEPENKSSERDFRCKK
ncbi:hypothetical protein J3P75_23500 [Pseudomonas sp. R1-1]|uniref:hypothetical protein n=1 Tax=Pseudomonas sp. R1-1 TaxID=1602529 RepID=UPI003DAA2B19